MTDSLIFSKARACADQIVLRFNATGAVAEIYQDNKRGINDIVFTSPSYRRAHISIVDARDTKKLWLLHCTIFPHIDDPSPIYGFDIVAGPNKVSGAFHDFSNVADKNHPMMEWFAENTKDLEWNKKRELPDWAKEIFSDSMVAIGAVGPEELDAFIKIGLKSLDYYMQNVGKTKQEVYDYSEEQDRYCHYQKLNPHTPRVLVTLGFTEEEAKAFVAENLFPEIG